MIYAFIGLPGSGKSYSLIEYGFQLAEKQKRHIVTNYVLDEAEAYKYCRKRGMHWLAHQFRLGKWQFDTRPHKMLGYANAVVMLDEAGIFLNSRNWADIPKEFIVNVCQQRKIGTDLLWTAQSDEMADANLRRLTNFYILVNSIGGKELKLGPLRWFWGGLHFRRMFDPFGLQRFRTDGKLWKHTLGVKVSRFDPEVFKVFDSFVRLENAAFRGYHVADRDTKALANLPPELARQVLGLLDLEEQRRVQAYLDQMADLEEVKKRSRSKAFQ